MSGERNRLTGLIAAPHTPFYADGSLNLAAVERQAEHLLGNRIGTVFVGGTTGESHSLSLEERLALTQRWLEIARAKPLRVIVHVGANCLPDARELAAQAGRLGAVGIAAVAPSYFKPGTVDSLVAWCEQLASAAPETPFYYYDIPVFTNLCLPILEFLPKARERIRNFSGLKFSNPDLLVYQQIVRQWSDDLDIFFGMDELLLAALVFGGRGAVGATYNFAAPIYHRLVTAFEGGDLEKARQEQFRSVQLIKTLARRGFLGASKAVMKMVGVDVGPARLPNYSLPPAEWDALRHELETLGFFSWINER